MNTNRFDCGGANERKRKGEDEQECNYWVIKVRSGKLGDLRKLKERLMTRKKAPHFKSEDVEMFPRMQLKIVENEYFLVCFFIQLKTIGCGKPLLVYELGDNNNAFKENLETQLDEKKKNIFENPSRKNFHFSKKKSFGFHKKLSKSKKFAQKTH